MKYTKILIVDDEKHIHSICKAYLAEMENCVVVGECMNIKDAEIVINATQPDIVLLDINLGENTGFDLLKKFSPISFQVIFITAYEQYALQAMKTGAIDYILKPIDENEFITAINKAIVQKNLLQKKQIDHANETFHKKELKKIVLSMQEGLQIVWLNELMFCHSEGSYTIFNLLDGSKFVISKSIKEYDDILPVDQFIRCHHSYLVNINFIKKLNKENILILKNNQQIPVSVRKKEEVLNWLQSNS